MENARFSQNFQAIFLQQQAVLRRTFTPPPPTPKKTCNRLLYCILKIVRLLYCLLKKAGKKSRQKRQHKRRQKRQQKSGKKGSKKVGKKMPKKHTTLRIHNTHANHQKKNFSKHIPEPVLLLS